MNYTSTGSYSVALPDRRGTELNLGTGTSPDPVILHVPSGNSEVIPLRTY
eukprot:SAG31_NODE_21111_length_557_cov_1.707424_1_plen_50_part_00